ncbi:hypothetical protein CERZMDRAFT_80806 [Cercospora zeae-maydis SCOH1-5]|uniref:Uncharacterized protein n=1 Tax=Cercospora zeae-maydis SCOH1-5 TaxID=717836 RepID=A0A6A6FTE7_9PEZI|nr:hypothetical protein CERZMDRAFT_80806 [Cercospora zeae-maydis SCOH1-5]
MCTHHKLSGSGNKNVRDPLKCHSREAQPSRSADGHVHSHLRRGCPTRRARWQREANAKDQDGCCGTRKGAEGRHLHIATLISKKTSDACGQGARSISIIGTIIGKVSSCIQVDDTNGGRRASSATTYHPASDPIAPLLSRLRYGSKAVGKRLEGQRELSGIQGAGRDCTLFRSKTLELCTIFRCSLLAVHPDLPVLTVDSDVFANLSSSVDLGTSFLRDIREVKKLSWGSTALSSCRRKLMTSSTNCALW